MAAERIHRFWRDVTCNPAYALCRRKREELRFTGIAATESAFSIACGALRLRYAGEACALLD